MYDFSTAQARQNTFAMKWEKYKGQDILPMWVADTEFACAPEIIQGLHDRLSHPVLGYHHPDAYQPARAAVQSWCQSQYQWDIDEDWIVWVPGVVPGFHIAIMAYAQAGSQVAIQTPNYPPLLAAPSQHNCQPCLVPTVRHGQRWEIDWQALADTAAQPSCQLMILCNPMNPVGTVLSQVELDQVAAICQQHDVILCSDEIHCDLILDDQVHLPAGQHPVLAERSVTLMSANKTFNVAGLGAAFAIIPDKRLRQQYRQAMQGTVPWVNILGLVATELAFTHGHDWHSQLLDTLRVNRTFMVNQLQQLPGFEVIQPAATFLLWADASGLGCDPQAWCEARGVGPSPGKDFGAPEFVRFNFGAPLSWLTQAMERLTKARV